MLAVSHDEHQYAAAVTSFTGFPTTVSGALLCGDGVFPRVCAADVLADVIIETGWKEWIVLTEQQHPGNGRICAVTSNHHRHSLVTIINLKKKSQPRHSIN